MESLILIINKKNHDITFGLDFIWALLVDTHQYLRISYPPLLFLSPSQTLYSF